ncbi:hypothetical protein [Anaerosacchariphilus polymeriproducens]|uniref:Uncharacterized protein n=1 Tax=Anaerosacchariphilus polymeriproducens TaxID=1812858 RepID=A0A371AUL3_9FIRM|nr:hypothetical protein [Anaerosacchariphilus polymeriproducens]RDU23180.1 hypothetical protein DWV06_10795 [Anaerosacchariphilus polymeriproducens]
MKKIIATTFLILAAMFLIQPLTVKANTRYCLRYEKESKKYKKEVGKYKRNVKRYKNVVKHGRSYKSIMKQYKKVMKQYKRVMRQYWRLEESRERMLLEIRVIKIPVYKFIDKRIRLCGGGTSAL